MTKETIGLPQIHITFEKAASTAVARSERGKIVMVLDDASAVDLTEYQDMEAVADSELSEDSQDLIRLAFLGGANSVRVLKLVKTGEAPTQTNDVAGTLAKIGNYECNWLCAPCLTETADQTAVVSFVEEQRAAGKPIKAVLANADAPDSEGIVNFASGTVSCLFADGETGEYSGAEYSCRIAGTLAGLALNRSATYYVLDEVTDAVLTLDTDETEDSLINEGKLIIIFDGEKYKIARGVTSLTTIGETQSEEYRKIKIVEAMDLIQSDLRKTFADQYIGKIVNSYDNKQLLINNINTYLSGLVGTVLDPNYENKAYLDVEAQKAYLAERGQNVDEMTDADIQTAKTGSNVFIGMQLRFVDAMEDIIVKAVLN